jgi:hypothetical protein
MFEKSVIILKLNKVKPLMSYFFCFFDEMI